ncbi:MAG: zinc ribbon domain-containing protein [Thermodesulfobacteriota bacterium]|nr:zinc ribbon domain-containing protein [Thermodesulfobacteriota bacterium]
MPIYEYHCKNCNHNFEYLVFGSEKPDCPSCSSKNVLRLMSACGFVSKGSGGETVSSSASSSACSGCAATSCSSCSSN